MQIELTPEMEELVRSRVASGRYPSAEAVLQDAIHSLEERERELQDELDRFRAMLQQSEDELESGDCIAGNEMFAKLRERSRLLKKAAA